MKKIVSLFTLLCVFGALAGCNTVAGAGKDMERGGEKIQQKAHEDQ